MQKIIDGIEKINKSMWTAYKEYLSTRDKKTYQKAVSSLEMEYDAELSLFCWNLSSAWENVIIQMEMRFEEDADVSDVHSCVSDIQNSVWAIYKGFMKDHLVRECTRKYAELVQKYRHDKEMELFAQTLILSWVPIINALAEDFRNGVDSK
ncbi:hypothetical protein [uncultured Acetatifactor sp.]|uniref:hypothetical protein n=1 Tax=uncultured Acetatifactor sp. TaxID=1671927 RepID=UPI00261EC445|nr:hypothetical protein [uncultured Acetatifactor sp.]